MDKPDNSAGLALLRTPFLENQISKLPKPTKQQTAEVKQDFKKGVRCGDCGAWHHPNVVHLDYVGHAALTDRLLDCDPEWNWEFVSTDERGLPVIDIDGGFWIRLTVSGVTRLGYGDAQGKAGGNAMKERIGDALRNAAMRFGAALDLWHKGDLHAEESETASEDKVLVSPDEIKQLQEALNFSDITEEVFCASARVKEIRHLEQNRFQAALDHIKKQTGEGK